MVYRTKILTFTDGKMDQPELADSRIVAVLSSWSGDASGDDPGRQDRLLVLVESR